MHQIRFRLGLCPRPHGGAYSASPDPLAGFKGPTSKGREGKGEEGEGEERGKGRGKREGRGEEGKGRGNGEGRGEGRRGENVIMLTLPPLKLREWLRPCAIVLVFFLNSFFCSVFIYIFCFFL